jgi:catechol-2,3-dioxygenase
MACCPPPSRSASPAEVAAALPKVHVHLQVADLAAATGFYRALFGEPVKLRPGYAKFLPAWAPLNLAVSERARTERGSGLSHLGIQVASPAEVQRHLQRVRAAGLPVRIEMGVDCCHANQDKFWVADPAGIEWEIYHLNHDLPEPDAACAPQGASSCCPA